jgi:CRP-like cAMP-binding protein
MPPRRRPPKQLRRTRTASQRFDPKAFLAKRGNGRTIHRYRPTQAIFSQGERADSIFYIQAGG